MSNFRLPDAKNTTKFRLIFSRHDVYSSKEVIWNNLLKHSEVFVNLASNTLTVVIVNGYTCGYGT